MYPIRFATDIFRPVMFCPDTFCSCTIQHVLFRYFCTYIYNTVYLYLWQYVRNDCTVPYRWCIFQQELGLTRKKIKYCIEYCLGLLILLEVSVDLISFFAEESSAAAWRKGEKGGKTRHQFQGMIRVIITSFQGMIRVNITSIPSYDQN
jgi:hypothetical protein